MHFGRTEGSPLGHPDLRFAMTVKPIYRISNSDIPRARRSGAKHGGGAAGGWAAASALHKIIHMYLFHRYNPVPWRGGNDSYRGLLVSDHVAKVLTSLLQVHFNDGYAAQVGESQFGAVAARGSTIASLALRCFHDAARMRGLSAFTLFVDLCTAFDYALREVVLG